MWARFGELSGLAAAGDSFPNQGHAGAGASAWVKVSPAALHTYQGWVQDSTLPMGTLLAMFHAAGTSRATASIYVMEKTPSGWRYGVVGADGRTLAAGNGVSVPSPAACAGCHAAAPADSVFGPPRTR